MSLSLRALAPRSVAADEGTPVTAEPPAYTDYRDVYRAAWRWDRVVRGTHLRYRIFFGGPVHVPRGIPIELEPVESA